MTVAVFRFDCVPWPRKPVSSRACRLAKPQADLQVGFHSLVVPLYSRSPPLSRKRPPYRAEDGDVKVPV